MKATLSFWIKSLDWWHSRFLQTRSQCISREADLRVETLEPRRVLSFFAPVHYDLEGSPSDMVVADFDNDSIVDIAAMTADGVSVLLGNGDGSFQAAQTTPTALGHDLEAGDFNNDGQIDLLVTKANSDEIRVAVGNGDGTFQVGQPMSLPGQQRLAFLGSNPTSPPVAADMDSDGNLDFVVGGVTVKFNGPCSLWSCRKVHIDHFVNVFAGNGDGSFTVVETKSVKAGSLAVGDFDNDGNVDVLTGGVYLLTGNGDGSLDRPSSVARKAGTLLAVADFNGDGNLDFLETEFGVHLGNGAGRFTAAGALPVEPAYASAGDINNDGILDLVTMDGFFPGEFEILLGNGDGTFTQYETHPVDRPYGLLLADLNGDGLLDIIAKDLSGLAIMFNDGNW